MPLHPAAPEDLPGLVEAYRHTVQAVIDLGHACTEADFARETTCPGWTVKDQVAHVVGVEDWVGGAPLPRIAVPDYPHLTDDRSRLAELHVEVRRQTPGPEVVAELEQVLAQRMGQLSDPSLTLESVVRSPAGPEPLADMLRRRIIDVWTHEQDMRQALGRPGDLDAPGASVFMERLFAALPRLVSRSAGIAPGNVVIFDVTGPVLGRSGVRVEVGEDGRPLGTPLFTGTVHEHPEDAQVTSITLSTDALTRRAAGRGGLEDIHYTVHGDEDVARRVLENLPFIA